MTTPYDHTGHDLSLGTPLRRLLSRSPVSCHASTSLGEAVRRMHQKHVSSIAIVDNDQRVQGIFTLRDLRRVFSENAVSHDQTIGSVMTRKVHCLGPEDTAYDAAMLMTRYRIGHVCIVDDEKLVGVLSERELFALQRINLVSLSRALRYANNVDELISIRKDIPSLVNHMLTYGALAPHVTGLISQLNDHTTTRVIELVLAQHGNPPLAFCWLSFGSEGRLEQTLFTDQDNGIVFFPPDAEQTESYRQQLLPIAQEINEALDRCGLSLCTGNIMASNPELCLSLAEWKQKFARIIQTPDAEHLLQASIFFDIRPLWGKHPTLPTLSNFMQQRAADNPQFQRMLATNALQYRLPVMSAFKRVRNMLGLAQRSIDLKTQALSAFVDAVRVLALAYGVSQASTLYRLSALSHKGVIGSREAQALKDAYSFLQRLRLTLHVRQARQKQRLSNKLDPQTLNSLERRILYASLRQAAQLQELLRFKYQL